MRPKSLGPTFLLSLLLVPALVFAADEPAVVFLWPNGAPGFADRKDQKEVKKEQKNGEYTISKVLTIRTSLPTHWAVATGTWQPFDLPLTLPPLSPVAHPLAPGPDRPTAPQVAEATDI